MRVPRFVRESRRLAALVLAALLVVGVASPAAMAQVQANAPTLSVTGMGTVTVAPDQARASLAVTTNDRLLAAAQEANTAITQKVMEALLASGVAREDIQTTSFTVWPQYSYPSPENPTQPPTIIGYQVRNELTVTVKTIANLGRVLDAGLKAGANEVYNIYFQKADVTQATNASLQKACQNAMAKAGAIAAALGMQLGPVLSVIESGANVELPQPVALRAADQGGGGEVPVQPGLLKIESTVSMTFSLR